MTLRSICSTLSDGYAVRNRLPKYPFRFNRVGPQITFISRAAANSSTLISVASEIAMEPEGGFSHPPEISF